jgi:hypothetical protein
MSWKDDYQHPAWKKFNLTINPYALLCNDCKIEHVYDSLRAHWSAFMVMEVFGELPYFSALKLFDAICMKNDKETIERLVASDMIELKQKGFI